jgi:hypothetical protein
LLVKELQDTWATDAQIGVTYLKINHTVKFTAEYGYKATEKQYKSRGLKKKANGGLTTKCLL